MKLFFLGPRILGIRPGIALGRKDFPGKGPGAIQGSFLYVIDDRRGHVKIGVTTDPRGRLAALQTANPRPLVFATIWATPGDGYAVEAAAHTVLERFRMAGEWFSVTPTVAVAAVGAAAQGLAQPLLPVTLDHVDQILAQVAAMAKPRTDWFKVVVAAILALSGLKWIFR
jgi:hypothetical protein